MSSISFFWSKSFLTSRSMLWPLFLVNVAGTIYGYIWYGNQLQYTFDNHPLWQIVFVPDSPTASLFFTLSLLYLLFPHKGAPSKTFTAVRMGIEALGVVMSIKYGIWAVAMIVGGAMQGDVLEWQHYMLIASHLGMAIEALLYVRFMVFNRVAALAATLWLLLNDTIDYTYLVYPWLPNELEDDLPAIAAFTFGLSIASYLGTLAAWRGRARSIR